MYRCSFSVFLTSLAISVGVIVASAATAMPRISAPSSAAGYQLISDHVKGLVADRTLKIDAQTVRVDAVHGVIWRVSVLNTSHQTQWLRLYGLLAGKGQSDQFSSNPALGEWSLARGITRVVHEMAAPPGRKTVQWLWFWPHYARQNRVTLMVETRLGQILAYRELRLLHRPDFVFVPEYYPDNATLTVKYEGVGQSVAPSQAMVRVVDTAGKTLWQRPYDVLLPLAGARHTRYAKLDAPLATGRYEVQLVDAAHANRVVALRRVYLPDIRKLITPLPRFGDNVVFNPWTPLAYHGNKIACWNRSYNIGGSGVVTQITSDGRNLLAAPVGFEVEDAAGQWHAVKFSSPAITTQGRGRARWSAQAEVNGVPWKLQAHLAYDGMLTCDVAVTPNQPPPWKAIRLVVPMPAKRATRLTTGVAWVALKPPVAGWQKGGDYLGRNHFGLLPKQGWTGPFEPFLTLGDLHSALCFSAESQRDWHLRDQNRAYQITTRNGVTRLVVNLADEPLHSVRPRCWRFGLLATPFKPLPRDWQTMRFVSSPPKAGLAGVSNDVTLHPGFWDWWWSPDRVNYAKLKKAVADTRKSLPRAIPEAWLQLRWGPDEGQFGAYVNSWEDDAQVGFSPYYADWYIRLPEKNFSPASRWKQFLYGLIKQMTEKSHIQGVYFDTGGVLPDWNLAAGRAFVDDFGRVQPFYDIYGQRCLMQALWSLFAKTGKTFYISELSNNVLNPPTITHTTEVISGEGYNSRRGPNYIQATGQLDRWSFEKTPTIWGTLPTFLPARRGGPWNTPSLLALSLLHATPLWVSRDCDIGLVNRVTLALAHNGVNNSTFHVRVDGAWVTLDPGTSRKVYAAVYAMKHAVVVVLSNLGAAPQAVTVTPGAKLAQLVGTNWRAVDILTGQPVTDGAGSAIKVAVSAANFRLLRFEALK